MAEALTSISLASLPKVSQGKVRYAILAENPFIPSQWSYKSRPITILNQLDKFVENSARLTN